MKLKDFFAFKDWLSYRQKVGLLVIAGVVCGRMRPRRIVYVSA